MDERSRESKLVARAQAGSLSAFEQLVLRHQDRLFRFLLARCASRADAEDVLQEAFASAWRYLGSYRDQWAFSTWLYRIARRCAARHAARPAPAPPPESQAADPTGSAVSAEQRRDRVWRTARDHLPPEQVSALWLYYGEDLPVDEVARALGRPVSWTKVNLFRARRRLARFLDRDELEDRTEVVLPGLLGGRR